MACSEGTIANPHVPFTTSLPGGIYPGRVIYISGIPDPDPSRFNVNLVCGHGKDADYNFHFDVRFNYGSCINQTVRTHRDKCGWGPEERRQDFFPFVPEAQFNMTILVEEASIKIAVNNQHFCEFKHRMLPLSKANVLLIEGDVRLISVKIQ